MACRHILNKNSDANNKGFESQHPISSSIDKSFEPQNPVSREASLLFLPYVHAFAHMHIRSIRGRDKWWCNHLRNVRLKKTSVLGTHRMQTGMSIHIKKKILTPSTRAMNLSTLFLQKHHNFLTLRTFAHMDIQSIPARDSDDAINSEIPDPKKIKHPPANFPRNKHHPKTEQQQQQQQRTLIPRDSRSATAASSTCFLRPMMAILAPWRPNWVAISKPIPDPPPVMSATLPCSTTFLNGDSWLPSILSLCKSFLIPQILCNSFFLSNFSPSTSRVT